jgi:galactokinase
MTKVPGDVARQILSTGKAAFGDEWFPERYVGAPGRIEVIGNHLDYNGGPVLCAAIDRWIVVGLREAGDEGPIRAVFANMSGTLISEVGADLSEWRSERGAPYPVHYLRGVIASLNAWSVGVKPGVELVVAGDLPHGIGISSSAALCVALVQALSVDLPSPPEIVLIAQEAEHRAGSPAGTMDQSASVFGGLIRFEGSTGAVERISADLTGLRFVVVNSGVVRNLATSSYPTRVRETQNALALLQDAWDQELPALGAIGFSDLSRAEGILTTDDEPVLARRVRHVVTEGQRVRGAEQAILASDWATVGRLMTESGRSSATDYDVSHPQVERIVSICLEQPGVLGARMMGGGQGGSVLVLIEEDCFGELADRLDRDYFTGLTEQPQVKLNWCVFAPGAGALEPPQAS